MTLTAKRVKTGDPHKICFEIPTIAIPTLRAMYERSDRLHEGLMVITLGMPRRPRTKGKGSQNSGVHGWCAEIAEQLSADDELMDPKKVYQAMKRMSVAEGYPSVYNPIDGKEEPESFARVSVEQASILIKVIMRFADENGLYLTEIVNGQPTKLVGGKGVGK